MPRIELLLLFLLLCLLGVPSAAQQGEIDRIIAEGRRENLRILERGDAREQIAAAGRLDAQDAGQVVPVLARHLQGADAALRLAAADTFWTLIGRKPEGWAAARPVLIAALDDADGAVAMNAAGALAALKTPPEVLVPARRRVLKAGHPSAYVRFLAARGLIGEEPGSVLVNPLLDYLDESIGRQRRGGASGNVQLARSALERLASRGERGPIAALEARLATSPASAPVLMRVLHAYSPRPEGWTETLLARAASPDPETVQVAWSLLGDQKDEASIAQWAPRAVALLGSAEGRELAFGPLSNAAGRTATGLPELAAIAEQPAISQAHRIRAINILGRAADAENREQVPQARLRARDLYLAACEATFTRGLHDDTFKACTQPLAYAVRDDKERAALLARWLETNADPMVKVAYLESLESLWSKAFDATGVVRAHLAHADPRVKKAALAALDRIRPAWRESAAREARMAGAASPAAGAAKAPTPPADGPALFTAIRVGDLAGVKKLVNAGNVRLPVRFPGMQGKTPAPLNAAINYCGVPTLSGEQLAAIVAHLMALGADPEATDPGGDNLFDRAKAACPPGVIAALGG